MPVLDNSRHELFAQGIAKGKTLTAAYIEAGYKPNDGAASRLAGNVRIAARVEELKQRAAVRCEISIASLTADLIRIAQKSEGIGEAPGFSVARASLMDAAKLNGLIVDKKDFSSADGTMTPKTILDVSKLSTEALREIAAASATNGGS